MNVNEVTPVKRWSIILISLLLVSSLSACGGKKQDTPQQEELADRVETTVTTRDQQQTIVDENTRTPIDATMYDNTTSMNSYVGEEEDTPTPPTQTSEQHTEQTQTQTRVRSSSNSDFITETISDNSVAPDVTINVVEGLTYTLIPGTYRVWIDTNSTTTGEVTIIQGDLVVGQFTFLYDEDSGMYMTENKVTLTDTATMQGTNGVHCKRISG